MRMSRSWSPTPSIGRNTAALTMLNARTGAAIPMERLPMTIAA
jgi:hypothetical protein